MRADIFTFLYFKDQQKGLLSHYALPFNWTDDSCSGPTGPDIDSLFDAACQRHDFGYRNFGRGLQLEPTRARKDMIDDTLYRDAQNLCEIYAKDALPACSDLAHGMRFAVSNFADSAFFG